MKKSLAWAVLATLILGGALVGCGEKAAEPATEPAAAAPAATEGETGAMNDAAPATGGMENASVVDFTNDKGEVVCPVMNTVIPDKSKAVGHQDVDGKRYYFCCGGCPDEFAADPTKFAKK